MENQKHRILIIDDDYDNRQLTKDALQYGGFETYDYDSPQLALEEFKQNPNFCDLVIIGVWLYELDRRQVYSENNNCYYLVYHLSQGLVSHKMEHIYNLLGLSDYGRYYSPRSITSKKVKQEYSQVHRI